MWRAWGWPRQTFSRVPGVKGRRWEKSGRAWSCARNRRLRSSRRGASAGWRQRLPCSGRRRSPRVPVPVRHRWCGRRARRGCVLRVWRRRGGADGVRRCRRRHADASFRRLAGAREGTGRRARLPARPAGPGWKATWTSRVLAMARRAPAVARLNSSERVVSLVVIGSGLGGWQGAKASGRRAFFFEKKKQKTFADWGRLFPGRLSRDSQKFFGSFFQKRTASFAAVVGWLHSSPPYDARRIRAPVGSSVLKQRW